MNIKKYKRTILFIIIPALLFASLINGCVCDSPDSGMFVALDYETNEVTHSTDGINWSQPSKLPEIDNVAWSDVCYGDGKFIAIAQNKDIALYSEDGIKWSVTKLPDSTDPKTHRWYSVCYGNGKFVAVSQVTGNNAAYSTDGIRWYSGEGLDNKNWRSVCYGNGIFVAVADNGGAAYSTDGKIWYPAAGLQNDPCLEGVSYGKGRFVAVGYETAYYSLDGKNWSPGISTELSDIYLYGVCYGNGKFVAVGEDDSSKISKAAYSTDGINWKMSNGLPSGLSRCWYKVCYGDGKFVSASYNDDGVAAYSTDGINWKEFKIPIEKCYSISYGFDSDIFGFL